ncbi:MAG: isochorismatase family protein [Ilumatobacteraceae bacterium]|nr:isochorismatase family protein [Ilumatobacteraceae bacterium]
MNPQQIPMTVAARPEPFTFEAHTTAVIVVDMQNDFGDPAGMFGRAGIDLTGIRGTIEPTSKVLAAARRAGILVVYLKMAFRPDLSDSGAPHAPTWLKHVRMNAGDHVTAPDGTASRILVRDTWNSEIVPELAPKPDDVVVYKHRFSGFFETDLDAILKSRDISTLVFTGCTTSVCVESTIKDAMFLDYHCLLLEDCTAEAIGADLPRTNHDASLLVVELLVGWVSNSRAFRDVVDAAENRVLSASGQ